MHTSFFRTHLTAAPIVAILRGLDPAGTADAARACWDAGIRLVEVPLQTEASVLAFETAAHHANDDDRLLGAGTVRTPDDVLAAKRVGARFLVAPGVMPDTIEAAERAALPILPGVNTPTEVETARRLGCTVQKLFPAGLLGGPAAIPALNAPYPDVAFVAVGSVTPQETGAYLSAGALGVGLGSALTKPGALAQLTDTLSAARKEQHS